ncbi:MAG TPA: cyclic nucleotide-binding domain-containing protein [Candidatus Angelobacter sp.]|nr:cyclic nucleotide-binding domain-containing protein [Candidatus Angelobacter sp.]
MSTSTQPPVMVHLILDGETMFVPAGTPILKLAWGKKIDIPVLCHEQDRTPVGVCRMCIVDVKGRFYTAACMLKAEVNVGKTNPNDPDLVIQTNTEEVKAARKTILQLLMSEHPQPCVKPERQLECELETLVRDLEVSKFPYHRHKPGGPAPLDESSSPIRVDHDACILCDRCIRACADEGHYVIAREGKGHAARITFGMGKPMHSSGCVSCGACVIACPTTAITNAANSPAYIHDEATAKKTSAGPIPQTYSAQSQALLKRGQKVGVQDLRQYPAFQHLSKKFLEQNLSCVVRRKIERGTPLFTEGSPGHTAFFIEQGNVDIFMRPRDPEEAQKAGPLGEFLRTLEPQELTGEMSCLNCYPRSASAIAKTDCVVLEMLRNVLEMVRNYRFRDQLDEQYRERALDLLVKDNKLFASLTREFADGLRQGAKRVCFNPGEMIFEEGTPADAFYLVSLGFVKVSCKHRGSQFVLAYLGPGNHFGEMSLLSDKIHHATCTALHHVEAIRIDGESFQKMMHQFPTIRQDLLREVERHVQENQEKLCHFGGPAVEPAEAEAGLEEAESMLVLDLDKCTRCDQCVIACAETHQGTTRLIRDGLRVDNYLVASACRHCHDPLCMVCHWDAITRDYSKESKAVIIHKDKCVGCGQCAAHCPYGNIKIIDEKGKIVPFEFLEDGSKRFDLQAKANSCDLCPDYKVPSCVYACPHDAAHRYSAAEFRSVRNPQSSSRRS